MRANSGLRTQTSLIGIDINFHFDDITNPDPTVCMKCKLLSFSYFTGVGDVVIVLYHLRYYLKRATRRCSSYVEVLANLVWILIGCNTLVGSAWWIKT